VSLGDPILRVDARSKVSGDATFPADLFPAGALHAIAVFTDQPHARLLRLDTAAAEAVAGVVAVFTADDVPVNEYGLTMFDQPVLVGASTPARRAAGSDVSRWEADRFAVVVAETVGAAHAGAAALVAEWEPLPLVTDARAALDDDVIVHAEVDDPTNGYVRYRTRVGDVEAAMATADVVVEGAYELPYQEHAYLQPEAGIGEVDDEGRITVTIAGQWVHEDQAQIAHALDLPLERIRVRYPAIGGAFGGREDMSLQIVLALAAWKLHDRGEHRAVCMRWSREESIVGHHKRHRGYIRARTGATADGRLVAVEADCLLDGGAYNDTSNKVLANLHLTVVGPYRVPNVAVDSTAAYTNNVPGGAFRGFGAPQGAFVAESQLNKLAAALGIDPVELRRRNGFREGDVGTTRTPLPAGVSLLEVVDACAGAAAWSSPLRGRPAPTPFASLPPATDRVRRGRGFACAYKNVGFSYGFPERCEAKVVFHGAWDDERPTDVDLFHAGAEVGQGAHTAFTQMAAAAIGIDVERVHGHFSDSATSGDSGSASASRLTFMAGNAILGAVEEAEKAWLDGDRPAVGDFRFVPRPTTALDPETGAGDGNITFGYVAQAVDVSVDLDTGHVTVHEVVNASDVGRAINSQLIEGQVHGALAQAHGYALTEDLVVRDGRVLNPRFSTYLIPGIGDVAEQVRSVVLEVPDPQGPWGARGMAEMPLIPLGPAIAAAVHDATGVWVDALPLTPDRVLAALQAASDELHDERA
jgi:CO/xanthine dehydrogenase Mo-binding subunit